MTIPASTPAPSYETRRQHTRIPIRMSAEVHVGDRSFTATSRDLSEGGCGLELKEAVPEKSEITLGLFLVIDDVEEERVPPLWVKGRVVWTSEMDGPDATGSHGLWMAGVRFEVITDQQKAWVRQILAHLAPAANPR